MRVTKSHETMNVTKSLIFIYALYENERIIFYYFLFLLLFAPERE